MTFKKGDVVQLRCVQGSFFYGREFVVDHMGYISIEIDGIVRMVWINNPITSDLFTLAKFNERRLL